MKLSFITLIRVKLIVCAFSGARGKERSFTVAVNVKVSHGRICRKCSNEVGTVSAKHCSSGHGTNQHGM